MYKNGRRIIASDQIFPAMTPFGAYLFYVYVNPSPICNVSRCQMTVN